MKLERYRFGQQPLSCTTNITAIAVLEVSSLSTKLAARRWVLECWWNPPKLHRCPNIRTTRSRDWLEALISSRSGTSRLLYTFAGNYCFLSSVHVDAAMRHRFPSFDSSHT